MFASRANTHLPLCFLRIDSVWPDRLRHRFDQALC